VLISANHRRFLDPIIVHTAIKWRRLHCLATKGLYDTKLKARFFNLMHCIEVDKENFSISSFHEVVTRLEDGKAVVIFPEGQINAEEGKGVLTFKSGAVLMAHKSGAPVLPMYIVKREKWYQRQKIVIGELFDVKSALGPMPSIDDLSSVSATLREKELALSAYYDEMLLKKNKRKGGSKGSDAQEEEKTDLEEYAK
jgi:1-acyl-sn-glycerol-3-phosphate acyltransferase